MRIFHIFLFFSLAVITGCISSSDDFETAKKIGEYLQKTEVIPTNQTAASQPQKIVYFAPGSNRNPHFTYYGVTSDKEINLLKNAAEEALKNVPDANEITLHFFEKEIFVESSSGWKRRGKENEIKQLVITRKK